MTDDALSKKRVVILGGGLGGLTAAYYLSDTPELREKYDVTVYQMGWRLGGKCASGCNTQFKHRVEEHGIHVFSGFYANAFGMLSDCYDTLHRPHNTPLSTCIDGPNPAFRPHNQMSLMEIVDEKWQRWDIIFDPDPSRTPVQRPSTLWHDLKKVCRQVYDQYSHLSEDQKQELRSQGASVGTAKRVAKKALRKVGVQEPVEYDDLFESLTDVSRLARSKARPAGSRRFCALCRYLKELIHFLYAALRYPDRLSDDVRHFSMLANLGLTVVKGVLKHGILHRGFDVIDQYDLRDWLRRHGASPAVCDSPLIRSLYAAVFAYRPEGKHKGRPRIAAGVALRVLWRTLFGHHGGFVWKMQAGMGETVVAPLYEVLKYRGVKFKFFRRVERLELSDDGKAIGRIHVTRQVTLKDGDYQPLLLPGQVPGVDVPAWPAEPLYSQIDDGQADRLREWKRKNQDLESAWLRCDFEEPEGPLVSGRDFDVAVLAIPVGALKPICRELEAKSRRWKLMLKSLKTIQTHSVQMWLNRSAIDLGWKQAAEEPLVVGYQKPFDSWVGMSQLLEREQWSPEDRVRHIAYFLGIAVDQIPLEEQLRDPDMPQSQRRVVLERIHGFLDQDVSGIWPDASPAESPSRFDWTTLVDPEDRESRERLEAQYLRANINPSDRYVLSLPGTTRYRLAADGSGFANLFLAGDWTRNGLNVGCAEATVMSGMQAARAISGRKLTVYGESDPTLPVCGLRWPWQRKAGTSRRRRR